ncbi:MAG: COX15/CtaA family protein [Gemmatimonadales bacterium]
MRFRRYAWGILVFNLAVMLWGAFVRATGSGAGCGRHWPLCNAEVVPRAPATETLIEFVHRATSGIALLLVFGLWWWARRLFPGGHRVRRAAGWAAGFVVVEALIGAGLVLFELVGENDSLARAGYLAAHLLNTFLLLGALALTAFWAGRQPGEPGARGESGPAARRGSVPWVIGAGLLAVLIVAMTGAVTALGDTLFPASSLAQGLRDDTAPTAHLLVRLRVMHPLLAIVTGIYLSVMVWLVGRERPEALEQPAARLVPALVATQLGVGLIDLLLLAPVALQLLHLLVADLLWVTLVGFAAGALAATRR